MSTWYADTDGDGFGNPASSVSNCNQPAGYVANSSDYDDSTVMITNLAPQTFYRDTDGGWIWGTHPDHLCQFQTFGLCGQYLGPMSGDSWSHQWMRL